MRAARKPHQPQQATVTHEDLEAEARRLLREQITRSAWFRNDMTDAQRRERIEQDVGRFWHLKLKEAAERLLDRTVEGYD